MADDKHVSKLISFADALALATDDGLASVFPDVHYRSREEWPTLNEFKREAI